MSNTAQFNKWHSILLHVSTPEGSSSGSSYETFQTQQFFVFYPYTLKNWCVLNVSCELPDDDSLAVETCSNVECHLSNWIVFVRRVLLLYYVSTPKRTHWPTILFVVLHVVSTYIPTVNHRPKTLFLCCCPHRRKPSWRGQGQHPLYRSRQCSREV